MHRRDFAPNRKFEANNIARLASLASSLSFSSDYLLWLSDSLSQALLGFYKSAEDRKAAGVGSKLGLKWTCFISLASFSTTKTMQHGKVEMIGMSRGQHFRPADAAKKQLRQLTHLGLRHRASK